VRVFVVGFMASGKSSVGRALAVRLGVPFSDLDAEVEAAAGATVREIFAEHGEAGFRRREQRALAALLERSGDRVIALGGGTPAQPGCAALLAAADGVSVWLDAPWETVVARVRAAGAGTRPLFADEAAARRLYDDRRPVYAASDLCYQPQPGESAEVAAGRLVAWLAAEGLAVGGTASGATR
jgi:shikimate kinase